jgi:hypothetical protein
MNQTEQIRAALSKHKPHKVRAIGADGDVRDVPVPAGRKRWAAVLEVVDSIEWTRLELVDRAGGLLAVVDAETDDLDGDVNVEIEEPPDASSIDLSQRDERMLALMLKAQQIALQNRERETQIALQASTSAVKMLTDAVGALAQVQRMTLDAQAEAYRAREREAPEESTPDSERMLAQLMPLILAKLGTASPAPAPKPNGVKS